MKNPGFIFYPGDYLRDTQCLSEHVQVAYDRIMCEHMRNICITQEQLSFFTKRLKAKERAELFLVVKRTEGGFHIPWVSESIVKYMAYSDSRRKNRSKKQNNISETYVEHMDNESDNDSEDKIVLKGESTKGENWIMRPVARFDLTQMEVGKVDEFIHRSIQVRMTELRIKDFWVAFQANEFDGVNFYPSREKCLQHFRNWLKKQNHADKSNHSVGGGKPGTSTARIEALKNW